MSNKHLADKRIQLLVVCAAILAVLILLQKYGKLHLPKLSTSSNATSTTSVDRRAMTTQQSILTPPVQGTPQSEQEAYFNLIQNNAKSTESLSLSKNCTPTPLVSKLKLNKVFTIKNTDSVDHTIIFNTEHMFTIAAGGSKQINANFGHNDGIYGYGCDSSSGAVGMVLVEP